MSAIKSLKVALSALGERDTEIAKLKRRITALEKDREFLRTMLLPNQIAVYKAAMRWYAIWSGDSQKSAFGQVTKLARACKKARGK